MSLAHPAANPRSSAREQSATIGILLLLGTVCCFAGLDATAKWINRTGNPVETAALRYIVNFVLVASGCVLWSGAKPGRRVLRTRSLPLQIGRGLCIVTSTLTSFFALRQLPLTQATAISFAAPLITALLAGPVLGEWPGRHRVGAVVAGFVGVLVVTRPWSARFEPAMLLAVLTAIFSSFYAMATRLLAPRDPPTTTVFYSAAIGCAATLPALPFVWSPPADAGVWLALLGLGVLGTLGHWLLILAHRLAPASTLAPFFYAQLIGAVALGWLVFGTLPDGWTVAGGLIVACSGLYLLHRERVRKVGPSADATA